MGFPFSKDDSPNSAAEPEKCATCPSNVERAVSLVQEYSLVGKIDPRDIISVLSDHGVDELVSSQIKGMGYWGVCAWMHTTMP